MKRLFDLVVSLCLLLFLSPVIAYIAWSVYWKIGSPVMFRQIRPGLNGKPFLMIKFRTMKNTIGKDGQLLSDSERMTPFGKKLRQSSLDELPELWNVIKGDMSLVGPRPLLTQYLPLYNAEQARRHEVRPGITGWAQVNGRNEIDWEEKFKLDVWYVDNNSFFLDLRILLKTVIKVFKKEGISANGSVTVEPFKGSSDEQSQ